MSDARLLDAQREDAHELLLEACFPARADRLKLIRGAVRNAAWMCGFDDRTAQNLVLAVDEACQNVIVHGYAGRDDGEIGLALLRTAEGLMVRLSDSAPPVDPAAVRPRALDDVRPGKLGTHFIREIMDSVEFRPGPGGTGNLLEMRKDRSDGQWKRQ
jgi:sigma-B regulation protein RsbU (phosphoserine phosphatase)